MQAGLAPEDRWTPRQSSLMGRILLAVHGGCTSSDGLRALFGVCGPHPYHKRLHEAVSNGWIEHTLTLTEAGRAAIDRMKK